MNRFLLPLLLFTGLQSAAQQGIPEEVRTTASVNTHFPQPQEFRPELLRRLQVPAGYRVKVAAGGLGKPRMMALNGQGGLYVTRRDVGDVLLLHDADGDGVFDDMKTVLSGKPGVHGITLRDGWIYLVATRELMRGRLNPDGTLASLDTLIADLPDGGQHPNRTIAFGPDGKLYITVGSSCNDCGETNPEHATILVANADGTGRRIYARGLRNTIGFDWHPQTGALWALDHGTDWRGDAIPPEELNEIRDSADYGWPLVWGWRQVDSTREDPVGTTKEAYAKTTEPAVLLFPAHSAPLDFRFMKGMSGLPGGWEDDGLVTWHGSWNRKNPEGFKVQRIIFEGGRPVRAVDFLSGFLDASGRTRFGRPCGLALAPDGKVYVSDDAQGMIYVVEPVR